MEVKIDFTKSAQENAKGFYERAKKLEAKAKGAEKAVKGLEAQLEKVRKESAAKGKKAVKVRERKWYESFHWFFASDGRLAIGGRDAHQNELINSRHFEDGDLFFHADIFGASVTVLKDGINADERVKREVAQFAASYSSAWKEGSRSVDVYALRREQISKSTGKGSLGTGSFLMSGEREWFRSTALGLAMFVKDDVLNTVPASAIAAAGGAAKVARISQGKDKKSDAAKRVARITGYDDLDAIMQQLPAGEFDVKAAQTASDK